MFFVKLLLTHLPTSWIYFFLFILVYLQPFSCHSQDGWISDITSKKIYPHKKIVLHPFTSPTAKIKDIYEFFDKTFYQVDANFFKYHFYNPLQLSTEFMERYLSHSYELRKDSFILPLDGLEEDAIICGLDVSTMTVRLMALKKSLELGWKFKTVYLITRSEKERKQYQSIIEKLCFDPLLLPPIHYIFTYQATQQVEKGCKILKRYYQMSDHYLIIESNDLFAAKMEGRCRKILGKSKLCLGSNIFPIKNWREEAKIHQTTYYEEGRFVHWWFYSHMQFLARKIHYEFTHGLELDQEEQFAIANIKMKANLTNFAQKKSFEKLISIYYEKAICGTQKNFQFVIQLIRSFGLTHYIKNLLNLTKNDKSLARFPLAMHQMSPISANWDHLLQSSRTYRQKLKQLRKIASQKLLYQNCDPLEIQQEINQYRDRIVRKIVKKAINTVGIPPCKFSLLVYGSSGRSEATPYSDLEFGIIYEKESKTVRQYFQALATCIIFRILDLSETILFQLNFPCFSYKTSSNRKQQWFLDQVIPRGFSIDIIDDPHSSKLPVATGSGVAFIGTAQKMASNCLRLMQTRYFGYGNLSERVICGSQTLFKKYRRYKRQLFCLLDKKYLIATFREALHNYSKISLRSWDQKIDIKNSFYRPLSLALETLCDIYEIDCTNSLDRICELARLKVITDSEAKSLATYFIRIQKIRLKLTIQRKGQYEGACEEELPEIKFLILEKKRSERIFKRILTMIAKKSSENI